MNTSPARVGLAVLLALATTAGCGGTRELQPTAAESAAEAGGGTADVLASPAPASSTAGPLTERQMPTPAMLGPGWSTRTDVADEAGGTLGNGAPTQQRQVDELLEGLTPVGCPYEAVNIEPPRPQWALEGGYVGPKAAPGVALVLDFPEQDPAAAFLDDVARQAEACPPAKTPPAADAPPALAFTVIARKAEQVSALRQETGFEADPNRYLVVCVRRDGRIGLLYLAGGDPTEADRLGVGLAESITRT